MVEVIYLGDKELEQNWQWATDNIRLYLTEYYKTNDESFRKKAEEEQKNQDIFQTEITRRSH